MAQGRQSKTGRRGIDHAVGGFATALEQVVTKLGAWRKQRAEIASDIQRIVAAGQSMLLELGEVGGVGTVVPSAGEERHRKGGRPKGYKMSAATKAKLKAAWARRRAVAAGGAATTDADSAEAAVDSAPRSRRRKKRTMSAEARARIAAAQKKRWALRKKAD